MADEETNHDGEATAEVAEVPPEPAPEQTAAPEAPVLPTVTTAAQWKRRAYPSLVQLPSGVTIKARRPDFHVLLLDNVITVEQMQEIVGRGTRSKDALYAVGLEVLPYMVVEPIIVRRNGHAPADDVMVAEDIPEGDVVALVMWGIGHLPLPTIDPEP